MVGVGQASCTSPCGHRYCPTCAERNRPMARLLSFTLRYENALAIPPGGAGGSCVDLVNMYRAFCYGEPHVWSDAVGWAALSLPGWTWIANTASNFPAPGDIVVWGA